MRDKDLRMSGQSEYIMHLVVGVWLGTMPAAYYGEYLKKLGYSFVMQLTAELGMLAVFAALSMLLRYGIRRYKANKYVVMVNQSNYEYYIPDEWYAFPIPDGVESSCLIQREYSPSVMEEDVEVWGSGCDWLKVSPKPLSEYQLTKGQRYYVCEDMVKEDKRVVAGSSRCWFPWKIV